VSRVAVIGEHSLTAGFALAGAVVVASESAAAARSAWDGLPADVAVVILTAQAAAAIGAERYRPGRPLTVEAPP